MPGEYLLIYVSFSVLHTLTPSLPAPPFSSREESFVSKDESMSPPVPASQFITGHWTMTTPASVNCYPHFSNNSPSDALHGGE